MTMITTHTVEELVALKSEGFLPIDDIPTAVLNVGQHRQARTARDEGTKTLDKVTKPWFSAFLIEHDVKVLTLSGQPVVRRSTTSNTSCNYTLLKAKYPEAYKECVKHTPGVSIWVSK